jgi:ankyrin repeat protein
MSSFTTSAPAAVAFTAAPSSEPSEIISQGEEGGSISASSCETTDAAVDEPPALVPNLPTKLHSALPPALPQSTAPSETTAAETATALSEAPVLPHAVATPLLPADALTWACVNDWRSFESALCTAPHLIQARDAASGASAVHWAALYGHVEFVQSLKYHGAAVDAPVVATGMQPLHWAATRGHMHMVRYLIEQCGVPPSTVDVRHTTALMLASQYAHSQLTFWLSMYHPSCLPLVDVEGDSALHWAAYKGNLACFSLLCDFGMDPLAVDSFGSTALHLAIARNSAAVVRWLLQHEAADALLAAQDSKGRTPAALSRERGERHLSALISERVHRAQAPLVAQLLSSPGSSLFASANLVWHRAVDQFSALIGDGGSERRSAPTSGNAIAPPQVAVMQPVTPLAPAPLDK